MAQPPKPPPGLGQEFLDGLEAATADLDNVSLVGLDGETPGLDQSGAASSSAAAPTPEPEHGERNLEAGAANLEIALDRDPGTGEARPPKPAAAPPPSPPPSPSPSPTAGAGNALALDFDAAGLAGPVKGQSAPGPESTKAAPPPPDREPAPAAAPTRAPGEKIGLFGEDRVLGFLVGGAIGLLVGIYPALQSARGMVEEDTRDAMAELEDAVDRPLAVRAGDVRSPGEITADIERVYDPARSRFWMVWLGIAIPVGAGLGLIRRKA